MSDIPPVQNPFASPISTGAINGSSDDEAVRNQYLSHEASIKSIGLLYVLGGVIGLILGCVYLAMGVGAISMPDGPEAQMAAGVILGLGVFFIIFSLLQLYGAISIRKLENVGRIIVTIFSVIGLLGIPIGTLISAYILYLLWSAKGKFIFTPEYRRVVEATPHIKYKTSIVVWILLGLLLLIIALALMSVLFTAA
jgi:hypothetical protein